MSLIDLYIMDKQTGDIWRIGDNKHDMLTITDDGQLRYHNLHNGDGCETGINGTGCGYEFVPNEDSHGYNADPTKGEERTIVLTLKTFSEEPLKWLLGTLEQEIACCCESFDVVKIEEVKGNG